MNIPEVLEIFGRIYTVAEMGSLDRDEGTLGMAAYKSATIYLDTSVDALLLLKVIWHEAIHMAQQEINENCDEAQARWISLFIHNFLMENPGILECYLEVIAQHYEQADTQEETA